MDPLDRITLMVKRVYEWLDAEKSLSLRNSEILAAMNELDQTGAFFGLSRQQIESFFENQEARLNELHEFLAREMQQALFQNMNRHAVIVTNRENMIDGEEFDDEEEAHQPSPVEAKIRENLPSVEIENNDDDQD